MKLGSLVVGMVGVCCLVGTAEAKNVRLVKDGKNYVRFNDPANWLVHEKVGTNKAAWVAYKQLPTAEDMGCHGGYLDLCGGTHTMQGWDYQGEIAFTNGTLNLKQNGGAAKYQVGDGAVLNLKVGGVLGFQCPREGANNLQVLKGGKAVVTGQCEVENLRMIIEPGGVLINEFSERISGFGGHGDRNYKAINGGKVVFPKGWSFVGNKWGVCSPRYVQKVGAETEVGGDIVDNGKAKIRWIMEGGRLRITKRARFGVEQLLVTSNAVVEIKVERGVLAELSGLKVDVGAKVIKTGKGKLILGDKFTGLEVREGTIEWKPESERDKVDWRFAEIKTWGDKVNRCYYLEMPHGKEIESITYTYPNKDAPGGLESETTTFTFFRRRFPEGIDRPFEVQALVKDKYGRQAKLRTTVTPKTPEEVVTAPWYNDDILVGACSTGWWNPQLSEIATNDMCNLIVMWGKMDPIVVGAGKEKTEEQKAFIDIFHKKKKHLMSIYPGSLWEVTKAARAEWGERYHNSNIGEYCSYLYQGAENCRHIPGDKDMLWQRERLVTGAIFRHLRQHSGEKYIFSTSGSVLANYELQGGIEFICNELYAMGAMNLGYATSEARGAARRWKPEYWCSWHAHDWQTMGIPFFAPEKYDLLLAGYLQQYVMGTSLIVLESGSESAQAWKYTALLPGETNRFALPYHTYPSKMYRAMTKRFYDFTRENPRDKGTPDTNIAFALGHLDAYVGIMHGAFAMWGNHKCAATNKVWKNGLPEGTWIQTQEKFFPRPRKEPLKPYTNAFLSGSPYGQIDIIGFDDEARYSDIKRYKLFALIGWNTMTPAAVRCLEKYVRAGGTAALCAPHLSTRTDRDYLNYTVEDLLQLKFAGIEVTGKVKPPKARWAYAEVKMAPNCKVIQSREGQPLIVEATVGKGKLYFYTQWDYPAWEGAPYYNLLAKLADEVPQRVVIREVDAQTKNRDYICFAAYGKKAYFLNIDCQNPRKIKAVFANGEERILEVPPCTVLTVDIPQRLHRKPSEDVADGAYRPERK